MEKIRKIIKEGTILVTVRKPKTFFHHLGIVAVENGEFQIYDLHPEHKNGNGGNLNKSTLEEYLKGKKLIGIYPTNTSTERIKAIAEKCWSGKYDKEEFNCQKFIDYVTNNEVRSDLYSWSAGVIIASAVLALALTGGIIYVVAKNMKPIKLK